MLPRRPDWPERLAALEEQLRTRRFRYGVHDCATIVSEVVGAISGYPLFSPPWRDRTTARRVLACYGGLDHAAMVEAHEHGLPSVAPAFASRGDLLLAGVDDLARLGFVASSGRAAWAGRPAGLVYGPVSEARLAWRVG